MMSEAEMEMMQLQVKKCQKLKDSSLELQSEK